MRLIEAKTGRLQKEETRPGTRQQVVRTLPTGIPGQTQTFLNPVRFLQQQHKLSF